MDSHPFERDSMSIGHPIPEIWLFQNLTMKIEGQGHGWGQSWKSQSGCKIPIDSHPFRSMSISHPIPEIRLFQNLTLKIQGQGHGWGERWKSQSVNYVINSGMQPLRSFTCIIALAAARAIWNDKISLVLWSFVVGAAKRVLKSAWIFQNDFSHSCYEIWWQYEAWYKY